MKTSWGPVAEWYDKVVHSDDSYQVKVILPNLLRIIDPQKNQKILDIACGEGFFGRAIAVRGAQVTGVDIAEELIDIAQKRAGHNETYFVSKSDDISRLPNGSFDSGCIVLALQNIELYSKTLKEASRIIKKGGKFSIVLNHPTFRIPGVSSWGYDEDSKTQYRRVDGYLSEFKKDIDMNPGAREEQKKIKTVSFHRPLQMYAKALHNAGFAISRIEEWVSHKDSENGPRKTAEDRSRREIPMFMCLECVRIDLNEKRA